MLLRRIVCVVSTALVSAGVAVCSFETAVHAQPTELPYDKPGNRLRILTFTSTPVNRPSTRLYRTRLSQFVGTSSTLVEPVAFHASGATSSKSPALTVVVAWPSGAVQSLK